LFLEVHSFGRHVGFSVGRSHQKVESLVEIPSAVLEKSAVKKEKIKQKINLAIT